MHKIRKCQDGFGGELLQIGELNPFGEKGAMEKHLKHGKCQLDVEVQIAYH
jgi:hypothetical protein